ncbi:MAG: hypothetical protein A2474_01855 [Elusimicrobia bacterium RIFOXYC2_FULL_34_12]|nr:MAG: hypothetical protein A2474_01855 [Elusimicrobia bacterium RIFOXYC2_FULL_34_12]OGS38651.1 MAG: hypothetical protein A2551_06505 [Elusimicrobia bacterium RIFOXYD2_FULL_34_30]HAM39487.1 hypothetical protein [Elusimicrobiota bacterium]
MNNLLDLIVASFIIVTNVFLGPKYYVKENYEDRKSEVTVKSVKGDSDLKKITFILHKEKVKNVRNTASRRNEKYKQMLGRLKWKTLPVSYGVNSEEYFSYIHNTSQEWNDKLSANIFAQPECITSGSLIRDGYNTFSWQSLSSFFGRDVISVTRIIYNTRQKTVVEFDVAFNSDMNWSVNPKSDNDVNKVASDAFKNVISLIDLKNNEIPESKMYGYLNQGVINK